MKKGGGLNASAFFVRLRQKIYGWHLDFTLPMGPLT